MATEQQIAANRRNAQRSTGPRTPAGKAASRLNALKRGLTSSRAITCGEVYADFDLLRNAFYAEWRPAGVFEITLVQQMVMAAWRLQRLRGVETGLLDLSDLDLGREIDENHKEISHDSRLAYLFRHDSRHDRTFPLLARYEAQAEHALYRAMNQLQRLRSARPAAPPDYQTSPISSPSNPPPSDTIADS